MRDYSQAPAATLDEAWARLRDVVKTEAEHGPLSHDGAMTKAPKDNSGRYILAVMDLLWPRKDKGGGGK